MESGGNQGVELTRAARDETQGLGPCYPASEEGTCKRGPRNPDPEERVLWVVAIEMRDRKSWPRSACNPREGKAAGWGLTAT